MNEANSWRPTHIRRFIKAFDTSACTVLVETDAGRAYLKAIGNNEGTHTLVAELVGTRLARWLGLRTLEFELIRLTKIDEVIFHNGNQAQPGHAFVTREERGEQWSGSNEQLSKLENPEDLGRLVVFDTWTRNCDRYSKRQNAGPRINRANVFLTMPSASGKLTLRAIDHTHCFTCGRDITPQLRKIDTIRDESLYGLFPEFRARIERGDVVQAASGLRKFSQSDALDAVAGIPAEWDLPKETQEALVEFIVRRAVFVADNVVRWLDEANGKLTFPDE
jgi:hypothetical protein